MRTIGLACTVLVSILVAGCGSSSGSDDGGLADTAATGDGPALTDAKKDLPTTDATTTDANAGDAAVAAAPVVDPAPGLSTPGRFTLPGVCTGCPTTTDSTFTVAAGTVTSQLMQGVVAAAAGNGTFYVESVPNAAGQVQRISGPIPTDASGSYAVTIPLFCGVQTVKQVWSNASGMLAVVKQITTTGCTDSDIRVTISWDDVGRDWELHLIKPGGHINDQTTLTDCTWTTCISTQPDWGVVGDTTDNPHKDVDNTGAYGPENIYLSKPETGRYTVMVEHWGSGGGPTSGGQAIINVRGVSYVFNITNFVSHWVWTVATIDWPSGVVTPVGTRFDCTVEWSGGCIAALP